MVFCLKVNFAKITPGCGLIIIKKLLVDRQREERQRLKPGLVTARSSRRASIDGAPAGSGTAMDGAMGSAAPLRINFFKKCSNLFEE